MLPNFLIVLLISLVLTASVKFCQKLKASAKSWTFNIYYGNQCILGYKIVWSRMCML